MRSFYTFYKADFGKISEQTFRLFWSGNYKECLNLYEQIIAYTGSIEVLGFNDTLIYHHCCVQEEKEIASKLIIPKAPNKLEIEAIYKYEKSQEDRAILRNKNPLLVQPKLLSKSILAAKIGIESECEEVIETGTFLGSSSYIFSGCFTKIETIEADRLLYESAVKFLSEKTNNVKCYWGNSGEKLFELLKSKDKKQLIFLDAHYSTGITSKKYGICPLINELDVLMSENNDHIVVIDDIRCMGNEGYPTTKQILDKIPEGRTVQIKYDQMIII